MHTDPPMKFWEKFGWYLIALTVIVGVIFFATIIAFFATGGFGRDDVIIAHVENGQWSVEVNCPLGLMTPDVTVVTAEKQTNWWAREREILWIRLMADSAKITFLPMDSVKVALWFNAQKRNYSLSLLSETTVRDTFDLWNKNRPEYLMQTHRTFTASFREGGNPVPVAPSEDKGWSIIVVPTRSDSIHEQII